MFSSRVTGDLEPNRLARALHDARAAGRRLLDLTVTNPTACGIRYPAGLLAPLAASPALRYEPSPFGLHAARAAVALEYARRGISVATDRVLLTASTSEAYSLLFKLLCEPHGEAVLVPVPSYPLFDHLTRLDGVRAVPYRLEYHGRWTLDVESVEHAWLDSVRAVLAVSPNNPTGSVLAVDELDALGARCAARGAALILDEVFADYPLHDPAPPELRTAGSDLDRRATGSELRTAGSDLDRRATGSELRTRGSDLDLRAMGSELRTRGSDLDLRGARSLTPSREDRDLTPDRENRDLTPSARTPGARGRPLLFRLGGLSKSAGLPQLKLGWIAIDGPDDLCSAALERLEVICDTYLSVSTPVQVAAPALLAAAGPIRTAILERVRTNYAHLRTVASRHSAVEVLRAEAGWSAVLRVPATTPEEELALDLLEYHDVIVHPGFFFDFPHEAFLVVSLLPEPACFSEGITRILERTDA